MAPRDPGDPATLPTLGAACWGGGCGGWVDWGGAGRGQYAAPTIVRRAAAAAAPAEPMAGVATSLGGLNLGEGAGVWPACCFCPITQVRVAFLRLPEADRSVPTRRMFKGDNPILRAAGRDGGPGPARRSRRRPVLRAQRRPRAPPPSLVRAATPPASRIFRTAPARPPACTSTLARERTRA